MESEYTPIPYGEAVSDKRPAVLSWDRCDAGENEYGEYCYYGVVFDPASDEVVYITTAWPLKSLVGNEAANWLRTAGYVWNEETYEWDKEEA